MGLLFENRKQVTPEELMMKYATRGDYDKLVKRPSFEVTKDRKRVDVVNGGVVKTNKSNMMRTHFMATDPTTGKKVEIRYAESNNERIVGDRVVDNFEPRYIDMKGATFAYQNDIHKAVYVFLNPNNGLSTLRSSSNKTKPKFEYIDSKKRAQAKTANMDALTEAMAHSGNLTDDRVILLAKGLKLKGIDKKDIEEVRTDVREYAMKNPKMYNDKVNSELTFIEGRIWNLVDKGIVKLSNVGSVRRWSWATGSREGEVIVDIVNTVQDAKTVLKNHFFEDLQRYMNILNDVNNDLTAKEKAEMFLKRQSEPEINPAFEQERVIGDALPAYLKGSDEPPVVIPKYTKEDAIRILTEEDEYKNPPHHKKVEKWLRENNGE